MIDNSQTKNDFSKNHVIKMVNSKNVIIFIINIALYGINKKIKII